MLFLPSIIILSYILYWLIVDYYFNKKEKYISTSETFPHCSIIICAHNEEKNIEKCLESILNQKNIEKYAEIILVNDASEDNTLRIAYNVLSKNKVPFQIITNEKKTGKKKSIEKAIKSSSTKSEWIILRDADTYTLSNQWFSELLKKMSADTDLILAPVIIDISKPDVIKYLQYFENLALMNLTLGSLNLNTPILSNAANIAFKKSCFEKLSPYKDNYHINSGDDIFLLLKMYNAQYSISSSFNKDSIVLTYPPSNIQKLFRQKRRWLSKNVFIKNKFNYLSMFIIGSANLVFIPLIFYSVKFAVLLFCIKIITDYKVISSVTKKFYLSSFSLIYFLIAELLYIPYVCALIFYSFISKKKINDRRTDAK